MENLNQEQVWEKRNENYEKILNKFGVNRQGEISLPVFAHSNISAAALEGVRFDFTAPKSPFTEALSELYKEGNPYIAITMPVNIENQKQDDFIHYFDYGCICEIKNLRENHERVHIEFCGVMPVKILRVEQNSVFRGLENVVVSPLPYEKYEVKENEKELLKIYRENFEYYISKVKPQMREILKTAFTEDDTYLIVNKTVPSMISSFEDCAFFMTETDAYKRLVKANEICLFELKRADIKAEINNKVQDKLEKNQKEMILREQLKVINDELDGEIDEIEDAKKKVKEKGMPKATEDYVINEINKLKKLPFGSPETGYIRNFLDTVLSLPFKEKTADDIDLTRAKEILDSNHYGLEEVKERIIEYIAVLKKTKNLSGQILCFVGPPGIGKTSIVQSIAEALNRKFVQMSLGGISDESLIRGHSRTYVGARAGRIIMGMQKAKTVNPVFLLDEVDKLARDVRGDPAAALLEVLDPEQNSHFKDNFMEIEYDLSNVLFVATANDKSTIPAPLLDRMELIELTTYTEEEKVQIAKRHLIPKQLEKCGLTSENIEFTDDALRAVITDYSLEAGVRNLDRRISQICRKVVVKMGDNADAKFVIDKKDLQEYLGAKLVPELDIYGGGNVGEAVGLAWTQVGGTALLIEVALSEGKGNLKFTGKLGDVFKESVELAMSVVKTKAKEYGINPDIFKKTDVHIHLPEMAIGKDGPSAGITLTTALMSAFTHRATKPKFTMTGEVSLLGRVLPIGGLKEKLLAAIKIGATDVIIPETNRSDYEKNKELIDGKLNIHFVSNIDEVLNIVLQK